MNRQSSILMTLAATLSLVVPVALGQEDDDHKNWTAVGKVTDPHGEPIDGVEIRVATGMGTLLGGGSTRSGPDGRFTLRFGEGCWTTADAPNVQVAMFMTSKEGYVEFSRSRPDNTMMARFMPGEDWDLSRVGVEAGDLAIKGEPYSIDFVMSRPAVLAIDVIDESGEPIHDAGLEVEDSNQSSRVSGARHPNARYAWGLCPGDPWTISVPTDQGWRFRTPASAVLFEEPGTYRGVVRWVHHPELSVDSLTWVSLVDEARDVDVLASCTIDSPLSHPPLAPADQQIARAVVHRVAEVNRLWLSDVPDSVASYSFEFDGRIHGASELAAMHVGRTPTHESSLHGVMANPSDVVFRLLETTDDTIRLAYTWKTPYRVSIGNGISGSWRGYVSASVRDGVIEIDAATMTPRRLVSGEFVETFGEFVEVSTGQYVPGRIAVAGAIPCDWRFQVVDPGLWVLSEMVHPIAGEPSVKVSNVVVVKGD